VALAPPAHVTRCSGRAAGALGSVLERVSLEDRHRWPVPWARTVLAGDADPVPLGSAAPGMAQPGDASRSCSGGRKHPYGHSREKFLKWCLPTSISFFPFIIKSSWTIHGSTHHAWPQHRMQLKISRARLKAARKRRALSSTAHCAILSSWPKGTWAPVHVAACHCTQTKHPLSMTTVLGVLLASLPYRLGTAGSPQHPLLLHAAPATHPLPGWAETTSMEVCISAARSPAPSPTLACFPG